jgi:hypothetical protein
MFSPRLFGIVTIGALLGACATGPDPLPLDSKALADQNTLVSSLRKDEAIEDVLNRTPYRMQGGFDFAETDRRTTVIAFRNDDTGAQFSLVFLDGRLNYLLPDREATAFVLCRRLSTPTGMHWTEAHNTDWNSWLSKRNTLGLSASQNVQVPALRRDALSSKPSPVVDSIVAAETFVVYAPFIIIGAPAIIYEVARDKTDDEARQQKLKHETEKLLSARRLNQEGFAAVALGMNREQVTQLMGPSDDYTRLSDGGEYLWYANFSGVLLKDSRVILKERYVSRFWNDLNELRSYSVWIKENHFESAKDCALGLIRK